MNRAVIYARVSTEMQKEKHTIDSQLSMLPDIIKQKGYREVLAPYIDDGISGETIEERPSMIRLLDDAEKGLFDAVFVVDIDRLTRSKTSIDWEIIKSSLIKGKVIVETLGQNYNFEDADQELISDILSRFSAYEKKKILNRMIRGKKEKAKQGKFFGGKSLYGYGLKEETKEYKIIEGEARIIRMIYEMYLEGESIRNIPDRLSELGIPTPLDSKGYKRKSNNKKWATSTISRILKNSAYAGKYVRWKFKNIDRNHLTKRPEDEWISAKLPQIVSEQEFNRVQEALKSRRVLSTRNSKREYLLGGLIYCESCGCKMTGECSKSTNTETRYYICRNGRLKYLDDSCPRRSIRATDIENVAWKEIKRLLNSPKLLKKAIFKSKSICTSNEKVQELNDIVESKKEEQERLIDLYQTGKFDIEKLNSRIDKIKNDIDSITKKIESINENSKIDTRLKTFNELQFELKHDINNFDYEQKRSILKLLLGGYQGLGIYIMSDSNIEIRGMIDFNKIEAENSKDKNSVIMSTMFS